MHAAEAGSEGPAQRRAGFFFCRCSRYALSFGNKIPETPKPPPRGGCFGCTQPKPGPKILRNVGPGSFFAGVPDTHLSQKVESPEPPPRGGCFGCTQPKPGPKDLRNVGPGSFFADVPDTHLVSGTRFPKHPKVESQKVGKSGTSAPRGLLRLHAAEAGSEDPAQRRAGFFFCRCSRYALSFGNKIPETPKSESRKVRNLRPAGVASVARSRSRVRRTCATSGRVLFLPVFPIRT